MIKEYISEKYRIVDKNLKLKQEKYNGNDKKIHFLKKNIQKIQEESDITFDVFNPRAEENSLRQKMNGFYEELNQSITENEELKEDIEMLKEQREKYQFMFNEILELERKQKNNVSRETWNLTSWEKASSDKIDQNRYSDIAKKESIGEQGGNWMFHVKHYFC